jgi:hypothetical protein
MSELLSWPRATPSPQNLAQISMTSCGHSVDIVRLRTKSHGLLVLFSEHMHEYVQRKINVVYITLRIVSSGMLRPVVLVRTDVSEELTDGISSQHASVAS